MAIGGRINPGGPFFRSASEGESSSYYQPTPVWNGGGFENIALAAMGNSSFLFKSMAVLTVVAAATVPSKRLYAEEIRPADQLVSSWSQNSDQPLLYPKPANRPDYLEYTFPIEGDGTVLNRALQFPLQSTPGPRNILNLQAESAETPRENAFNRYFFAPAAPATPPIRPIYLGPLEWPDTLVSSWAKQQPLQAPAVSRVIRLEPNFDPDVKTSVFEQRVPVQAKPRPFIKVEYETPVVSISGTFQLGVGHFPVQDTPANRPYHSLDADLPNDFLSKFAFQNYFPGNFPALASPPPRPWVILSYELPDQFPSIWLPPAVFIPDQPPTPVVIEEIDGVARKKKHPRRIIGELVDEVVKERTKPVPTPEIESKVLGPSKKYVIVPVVKPVIEALPLPPYTSPPEDDESETIAYLISIGML